MRPMGIIGLILGFLLVCFGVFLLVVSSGPEGIIPLLVGAGLVFLNWRGGRTGNIVFGHLCIVLGCFLVTWGIYLLPYSEPTLLHIFTKPLFWGLFSIFGGFCVLYHAFCACVRREK